MNFQIYHAWGMTDKPPFRMINSWPTIKIMNRHIAKHSSAKEYTENRWCHSVWNLFSIFFATTRDVLFNRFLFIQLYAKQIQAFTDMHKSPKINFVTRQGKPPKIVTLKINLTHEEIWRFLATKTWTNFCETKHKSELKMPGTVRSAVYFLSFVLSGCKNNTRQVTPKVVT